jgi:hypothetical protein
MGVRTRSSARYCAAASLLSLLVGLLSTGIDALQEHSSFHDRGLALHSEDDAGLPIYHLIRCESLHKTEPCNACFFHKVLGNGLIPKENVPAIVHRSIEPADPRSVAAIPARFDPQGNRGPPNS